MTQLELKTQLHKLVDQINDEERLKEALTILSSETYLFDSWDSLSDEYKRELMERADEVGDDSKWMSRDEFFKRT